jgi:peptidoglycan DL-endopeptidase RipA
MVPRRVGSVVSLGAAVAVALCIGVSAGAAPGGVASQEVEISEAQERLTEIRLEASVAFEKYNGELTKMNELEEEISATEKDLDEARDRAAEAQANLEEKASQVYRSGNVGFIDVLMGAEDFSEFAKRVDLWIKLLEDSREQFVKVRSAKEALEREQAALEKQRRERVHSVDAAVEQKEKAQTAEDEAEAYLESLNGEMQAMIEEQQARKAERVMAAAQQEIEAVEEVPVPQVDVDLAAQKAARQAAREAAAAEQEALEAQRAAEEKAAQRAAERKAAEEAAEEAERQAELAERQAAAEEKAAEREAARQAAEERRAEAEAARREAERAAAEEAAAKLAAQREAERKAQRQAEREAAEQAAAEQAAAEQAAAEQAAAEEAAAAAEEAEATAPETTPVDPATGETTTDPATGGTTTPPPTSGGSCGDTFGGVQPHVAEVGCAVRAQFGIQTIYGLRPGDPGDHGTGLALDFMVYSDAAMGDQIAEYLLANQGAYGITYVIWEQQINFGSGWQMMEDRGSPTANHYDHVHASFG